MIDGRGGLAIAEVIFYAIGLPIAVYAAVKHGFGRSAGWFFLVVLALIRIVGGSMEIAVEVNPSGTANIAPVAPILSNIGLSPLVLCTLALLKRLHEGLNRQIVPSRVFWLVGVLPIVGLILSIVGASNISSSDPTKPSSALTYLQVSSILYAVAVGLEALVTAMTGTRLSQIRSPERTLFYAVACSIPLLIVRVILSVLTAYNYTNPSSPFNLRTGSIYVTAFMATFEEFCIFILYMAAAVLTPALPAKNETF